MFKYLILVIFIVASPLTLASSPPLVNGCPMSSEERLVCSVVLCNPLGLAIAESRSECLKINVDYAIYLATLGFWDSPPSCQARDENCNRTGRASTAQMSPEFCISAGDTKKQDACMAALGEMPEDYCNQFNAREKEACESVQNTGQVNEDYCDDLNAREKEACETILLTEDFCIQLAQGENLNRWRFTSRFEMDDTTRRLEKCQQLYGLVD